MAALLSASTAAKIRALLATLGISEATLAAPRPNTPTKPLPWAVRYSAATGAFIVYIPADSVCGKTLNLSSLTAATPPPSAPSGTTFADWYSTGLGASVTAIILSLKESDTGALIPSFSSSSSSTEGALFSATLAAFTDNSTGTPSLTQLVSGALTLGSSGSGLALSPPYVDEDEPGYIFYDLGTWSTGTDPAGNTIATFEAKLVKATSIPAPTRILLSQTTDTATSSSAKAIATQDVPVPFAGEESTWLTKKTATPGQLNLPDLESEDAIGEATQTNAEIAYFSDEDPVETTSTPFNTFVETANESSTYEEGSSS